MADMFCRKIRLTLFCREIWLTVLRGKCVSDAVLQADCMADTQGDCKVDTVLQGDEQEDNRGAGQKDV